jgi:anaerobic magnesium-protoporphyrin IX monomethyl ester cyclase
VKLLLIVPPFTDPTQPPAAIPSLVAAVKDLADDVQAWDLNLDAWDYLLDPRRRWSCLRRVDRAIARLERSPTLRRDQRERYLALVDAALRGRAIAGSTERVSEIFRSPRFFCAPEYQRAVHAVDAALSLVSAAYHPAQLQWGRFWPAVSIQSSQPLARETGNRRHNPFVDFTREVVVPRLTAAAPDLLGISVTYLDQVLPALTLAAECKRSCPRTRVVLGGQIVSQWGDDLPHAGGLWRFVDIFALYEGESALRGLLAALASGSSLAGVPNLVFRQGGETVVTRRAKEDFASLPCPDYACLPLERYWSPEPVLTVSAARGCYWGRCSFCSVSPGFRGNFASRPPEQVADDLSELATRHSARLFTFGDDALPRAFVRGVAASGRLAPGTRWQAELRWDALAQTADLSGLVRAGATNLIFGLESASNSVLRRMRKGATKRMARAALSACRRAGVGVNLQCFLGFPGERKRDVGETVRFLRQVAGPRTTVSCGIFELQKGSAVATDPAAFAITVMRPPATQDLTVRFEYLPRRAMAFRRRTVARIARLGERLTPQLRCGISAHALVYLASGRPTLRDGIRPAWAPADPLQRSSGIGRRRLRWDPESLAGDGRPRRCECHYVFDLSSGKIRRLGAVASTLLEQADGTTALALLMGGLSPSERRRIGRAVRRLVALGLLQAKS